MQRQNGGHRKHKKTDAPGSVRPFLSVEFSRREELLDKTQGLGVGLADVLAGAAVDALIGHDADVLTIDVAFLDGLGGTFFDALLAEGAEFGIDSIHSWVPPVKFLGSIIVPQFFKNAIQIS